jgi:hypothetical protein
MDGHFNPDLRKKHFADLRVYEHEVQCPLTQARMKFQKLSIFRPDLELEAKAELAGLSVEEAEAWWAIGHKAMTHKDTTPRYPELPAWVTIVRSAP